MTEQQEAEFVEQAFEKLKERGWFADQELERSTVTEEEIAAFEAKHQVTLPSLYKAYLMSYRIPDRGISCLSQKTPTGIGSIAAVPSGWICGAR